MAGKRLISVYIVWAGCAVIAGCCSLLGQSAGLANESQRARDFLASGQPEKAIPIYQRLVRALPDNPGLITDLGIALEMGGHDRNAIDQFNAALKLDPEYLNARLFLGLAYLHVGQPKDAIGQLRTVTARQPSNELARWNLGVAYISLKNHAEAEEQFRVLCKLNPRNPQGWYGLERCYFSRWLLTAQKLRHLAPDSGYTLALTAYVQSRQHQYASAVQLYRQAIEKLPTLPGLHAALAEVYKATGHPNWAAAEEETERGIVSAACTTHPLGCDFQADRYDELLASASHQVSAESYYWESKAYLSESMTAFAHLSDLPPSAELHEIMAEIDVAEGEMKKCVQDWQEALKLSPENPEIKKNLAIAYKRIGDQESARSLLVELVRSEPENADVNYLLGDTLLSLHQASKAVPFLEKAVHLNSSFLLAQSSLANAYLETGQTKQAIPHFKAALPIDRDGALHYALARAYQQEGQTALAEEMIKRYQEIRKALPPQPKQSPQPEPPAPLP